MRPSRVAAGLAVAGGVIYLRLLRDPVLTWGAAPSEAAGRLPGDELLEQPDGVSTRARTCSV